MSLERAPTLGSKPVNLVVKLPVANIAKQSVPLTEGLQELYRKGEFTDIALLCAGQTFLAHKIVLAAQSPVFRQGLRKDEAPPATAGREEVRLADVANPEAVKLMLDYMYEMETSAWKDYNPRTQEINKDVLRLAQNFQLPGLTEQATHWLAKDLSTGNVVERLQICEQFGLQKLTDKILEQLTLNRLALSEVASSPQIMQHPKLMQALLQMAAAATAPAPTPAAAEPPSPPPVEKPVDKIEKVEKIEKVAPAAVVEETRPNPKKKLRR